MAKEIPMLALHSQSLCIKQMDLDQDMTSSHWEFDFVMIKITTFSHNQAIWDPVPTSLSFSSS